MVSGAYVQINSPKPMRIYQLAGRLATMRDYPYQKGTVINVKLDGEAAGQALVLDIITPIKQGELQKHLKESGFTTVPEWIAEAVKLHGHLPKLLAIIVKI